jgi:hypothetical protein
MIRSRIEAADQHICREMAEWTGATVIGLVLFGCFLMLMGGLFARAIVHVGYHQLSTNQLGFVDGDRFAWEFIGMWGGTVSLLFGGNALRVLGCRELRRRKQASPVTTNKSPRVRAILQFLLAPIMLFWCVLCVLSLIRWLHMHFLSWPIGMWTNRLRQFDAGTLFNIGLWWLVSFALLCGGIGLIWSALRTVPRSETQSR